MVSNSTKRPASRSLFWRLLLRSLQVKRPQTALCVGVLATGAAVCSMLLNLYGGVQRKMTESFRAFGPNVIVAPRSGRAGQRDLPGLMQGPDSGRLAEISSSRPGFSAVPVLYAVMRVTAVPPDPRMPDGGEAVVAGADLRALWRMNPGWRLRRAPGQEARLSGACAVGSGLAAELGAHMGGAIELAPVRTSSGQSAGGMTFKIAAIVTTGSSQDHQVFVPLEALQRQAIAGGKVSVVEVHAPGGAKQIEGTIRRIDRLFPGAEARPVRQIVYSEGKVLGTVSRLTMALASLILVIIALCVAATMTALVLERRKDVAVMKALGADDHTLVQLFLAEGAVQGFAGGLLGFFAGALAARELALRLFAVALAPSWWVFPAIIAGTTVLAVLATVAPARIVRRIQPAIALKGA